MFNLAILDKKSAQSLGRRIKAQAPLARKDMAYAPSPMGATNDDELTEPALIGPVTVVAPGTRRVRAVVVRTCREQAIVEFDMPETANTYDLSEELLEAIPPTAWQECTTDPGYAYIDRITDVAGTKAAIIGLSTKDGMSIGADQITSILDAADAQIMAIIDGGPFDGAEYSSADYAAARAKFQTLSDQLDAILAIESDESVDQVLIEHYFKVVQQVAVWLEQLNGLTEAA